MAFLLSTALIVVGMGWFAFGNMGSASTPFSPVLGRCFASLLILMGVLNLGLNTLESWL